MILLGISVLYTSTPQHFRVKVSYLWFYLMYGRDTVRYMSGVYDCAHVSLF